MKLLVPLVALSLLFSGFGTTWRNALARGPQTDVTGAWQGTWHSEATGHRGTLRAVVDPASNAEGDHLFHYQATWMKVLSGTFEAVHRVKRHKDRYEFEGQHQMPKWAGGAYTYIGTVQGDSFKAAYRSTLDHGTFEMQRVR